MGPWSAEAINWTERGEAELAAHRVTAREVEQVFANGPRWFRNKRNRAGSHRMEGRTDGGRALNIIVKWDSVESVLEIITGWDVK